MGTYKRILKSLKELDKSWNSKYELFADNGSLLIIDRASGEILNDFPNVICDGGDPGHTERDGIDYIVR